MENNHIKEVAERLKDLREICGYTPEEVAEKACVDVQEYLTYESGEVDIPVSVLYAIAHALGVELTDLLTGEKPRLNVYSLVRADKGIHVERSKDYNYKSLAYNYAGRRVEPLLVNVDPADDRSGLHLNKHEGHEFHYCLEGRYEVLIGDHILEVNQGDSLYFNSKYPHAMRGLDGKKAKLLVIVI
jgi:transcriptional regulator with XRE-family HTH domain